MTEIYVGGKRIDIPLLNTQLAAVVPEGVAIRDDYLYRNTNDWPPLECPPEAVPIVDAHVAPPRVIDYAGTTTVDAVTRTTDDVALEVFRFPCELKHIYRAALIITGVDAGNGAVKVMDGRFVWKRWAAGALMTGITVVSDLHDAAAAAWAPNALPQGNDVVFTVKGAAGRTIDWLLVGSVERYAPAGLVV